jgi:hypothetical protein
MLFEMCINKSVEILIPSVVRVWYLTSVVYCAIGSRVYVRCYMCETGTTYLQCLIDVHNEKFVCE